jgi:hypothetical protein
MIYPISDIIEWGIDLGQFDRCDWSYNANFDIVVVREGSKLYTWLALFNTHKENPFWQV